MASLRTLLGRAAIAGIAAAATPATAADSIRVGVVAVYPPYSVPYAAEKLGYYKKANLDVEITLYRGSSPAQEALVAGLTDVFTAPPSGIALGISKGVKERIVAITGDLTPSGWCIMVRNDSPLKTPQDLAGKTIGIGSKGSTTDFFALVALYQAKVSAETVPLSNAGILPALKAKQIDAAVSWPLASYKQVQSGDYRVLIDFGAITEPLVLNAWAASDAIIAERPEVLRRWLRANTEAIQYMQAHEEWSLTFLKEYTDESDDKVIKAAYDDSIKRLVADQQVKPEWLDTSLDYAVRAGIPKVLQVEKIYAPEFVGPTAVR